MRFIWLIITSFFLLTGFAHQDHLKIIDVQTTINESQKTIRYDFKIKNTGDKTIGNEFDYPGYYFRGMEIVVVPDKDLQKFMKMMPNTKYKKMKPSGSGSQRRILPNHVAEFHAEYFFKDIKNLSKVKELALSGKLIILDGPNVIAELPLK
ncbi:hypothetical protein MUO14_22540 [Halobacillus shinanisalinarum]|uniref:Uncharacterized protein n=1 Tax=Halobacillus shinanisalinarum TaxID=2932258 RepID=A0ABY4GY56_9BACI|nr:hypothetical protein [Halobacillus shinanisalinarum]UOQ93131.1 hypothetical protein MUO14_22540 [Halobacillus shinanisalinarum]